jgi:hypothetical protein
MLQVALIGIPLQPFCCVYASGGPHRNTSATFLLCLCFRRPSSEYLCYLAVVFMLRVALIGLPPPAFCCVYASGGPHRNSSATFLLCLCFRWPSSEYLCHLSVVFMLQVALIGIPLQPFCCVYASGGPQSEYLCYFSVVFMLQVAFIGIPLPPFCCVYASGGPQSEYLCYFSVVFMLQVALIGIPLTPFCCVYASGGPQSEYLCYLSVVFMLQVALNRNTSATFLLCLCFRWPSSEYLCHLSVVFMLQVDLIGIIPLLPFCCVYASGGPHRNTSATFLLFFSVRC